jgi:tetratricopeptide (TPR) repeat protein
MAENPRIEELRRRVQMDPASIAFAALAEEYRRQGRHEEAIETCRAGLQRHPSYLSARVTLGRALIETGEYDAASEELQTVLRSAPENLAAIRGLALIHERLGHAADMDPQFAALMNAEVDRVVAAKAAAVPAAPEPVQVSEFAPPPESLPEAAPPAPAPAAERPWDAPIPLSVRRPEPVSEPEPVRVVEPVRVPEPVHMPDPAVIAAIARLERFLVAIDAARHA